MFGGLLAFLGIYAGSAAKAAYDNYDIEAAEKQLKYAEKNNDKECIEYWETQVQIRQKKHKFIDNFINMFFDKVITNKDFIDFKDKLQSELENI